MADIDWKGLSAAEIWAALQIAPHMAGPWSPHPSEKKAFRRLSPHGENVVIVREDWDGAGISFIDGQYASAEDMKNGKYLADLILGQKGWTLL